MKNVKIVIDWSDYGLRVVSTIRGKYVKTIIPWEAEERSPHVASYSAAEKFKNFVRENNLRSRWAKVILHRRSVLMADNESECLPGWHWTLVPFNKHKNGVLIGVEIRQEREIQQFIQKAGLMYAGIFIFDLNHMPADLRIDAGLSAAQLWRQGQDKFEWRTIDSSPASLANAINNSHARYVVVTGEQTSNKEWMESLKALVQTTKTQWLNGGPGAFGAAMDAFAWRLVPIGQASLHSRPPRSWIHLAAVASLLLAVAFHAIWIPSVKINALSPDVMMMSVPHEPRLIDVMAKVMRSAPSGTTIMQLDIGQTPGIFNLNAKSRQRNQASHFVSNLSDREFKNVRCLKSYASGSYTQYEITGHYAN